MDGPRQIIVVGAGAIGGAIGGLLFETGAPCVLVARGEHGRAIAEAGIDLRFPRAARRVRVPAVASLAEAAPSSRDLVLLATMGQHTEQALAGLDPSVPVASFQNGLGPIESIARRGHPALAAMVYVPAERRGPGVIALPATPNPGSILLGRWPRGAHPWADWLVARLLDAGFRAEAEPDIAPWLRAKLLTNLGGIVAALCDEPVDDVEESAQAEARAVWRAADEPFHEIPALLERIGPLTLEPVDGRARAGGSTRSALARGDELETASLHAGIVTCGRTVGVPTPVNEALIRLADQAVREHWRPGCLEPGTLRRLLEEP